MGETLESLAAKVLVLQTQVTNLQETVADQKEHIQWLRANGPWAITISRNERQVPASSTRLLRYGGASGHSTSVRRSSGPRSRRCAEPQHGVNTASDKAAYTQYVNSLVSRLGHGAKAAIVDDQYQTLQTKSSNLPCWFNGTTDVIITVRGGFPSLKHRIRIVMQLKSTIPGVFGVYRAQSFAEVLAASSNDTCAIVGVLTDLRDRWVFMWFTADTTTNPMNATFSYWDITDKTNGIRTLQQFITVDEATLNQACAPMRAIQMYKAAREAEAATPPSAGTQPNQAAHTGRAATGVAAPNPAARTTQAAPNEGDVQMTD